MTSAQPPSTMVLRLQRFTLLLLAALVVLCLLWELWLAPTGRGSLALKVVPLLFCAPGLWRHRLYTYRWLSLLVWLYFIEGVVRAWSDKGLSQGLAFAEVVLSLGLFAAGTAYIRWRLKHPLVEAAT